MLLLELTSAMGKILMGNKFDKEPFSRDESHRKILVVEDQKDFHIIIRKRLQTAKTRIEVVASGEEAVELLLKSNGFNLIVADYTLPGMSGVDLYFKLKFLYDDNTFHKKYHKMFMLTSSNDFEAQHLAEQNGLAFAPKPTTEDEWREFVRLVEYMLQKTSTVLDIQELKHQVSDVKGSITLILKNQEETKEFLRAFKSDWCLSDKCAFYQSKDNYDVVHSNDGRIQLVERKVKSGDIVVPDEKKEKDVLIAMREFVVAIKKDDLIQLWFKILKWPFIILLVVLFSVFFKPQLATLLSTLRIL